MAKKSEKKTSTLFLLPIPFGRLNFDALSDRLNDLAMRRIARISRDLHPDTLGEKVWPLSTLLRLNLGVSVGDTELSSVFHYTGPLNGHEEKSDSNSTDPVHVTFVTLSMADPEVYG
jgi:hypothetical protein